MAGKAISGVPLTDAAIFPPATGPTANYVARVGTQWMLLADPIDANPLAANPPQTRTFSVYNPGDAELRLEPMPEVPPLRGWVQIGGQYTRYHGYIGNSQSETWALVLPVETLPYGVITTPIAVGELVSWVDAVMNIDSHGLNGTARLRHWRAIRISAASRRIRPSSPSPKRSARSMAGRRSKGSCRMGAIATRAPTRGQRPTWTPSRNRW